jgi:hypothetical protein
MVSPLDSLCKINRNAGRSKRLQAFLRAIYLVQHKPLPIGDYYTNSRIFSSQNLEHHFPVNLEVTNGPDSR